MPWRPPNASSAPQKVMAAVLFSGGAVSVRHVLVVVQQLLSGRDIASVVVSVPPTRNSSCCTMVDVTLSHFIGNGVMNIHIAIP